MGSGCESGEGRGGEGGGTAETQCVLGWVGDWGLGREGREGPLAVLGTQGRPRAPAQGHTTQTHYGTPIHSHSPRPTPGPSSTP